MCGFDCHVLCEVVWFVVLLFRILLFVLVCVEGLCVLLVINCVRLHGVACVLLRSCIMCAGV